MFTRPRPRREVSAATMRLVGWGFRYSHHRDAYILRGVGQRVGPVLQPQSQASHPIHRDHFWTVGRRRRAHHE